MRTKRKYDLDKLLKEAEEDEKLAAKNREIKQLSQADIQNMVRRKKEEKAG